TLDARAMAAVDEVRRGALQQAQEASRRKREGIFGSFVSIKETTLGIALLRGRTVSLSPDFETSPGPNLHLILTTMLDPRDGEFPDKTSVDAGGLESPYGAQEYALSESATMEGLRTAVIYDTKLKRMYGFAQLQ
ncbi:MAG: DM13 domain-containing protein, partial [Patescibacteria group bacterium]